MKAFVIKNKEGKYRGNSYIGDVRDIRHAEIYDTKEEILLDDNEEVVEITIAEVNKNFEPQNYDNLNTEDKLKYRDEQVRLAVERSVDDYNKITDLEFHIKRLEEQLAEKDKEIEKLRTIRVIECPEDFAFEINGVKFSREQYQTLIITNSLVDYNWKDREKQIRKQVCDDIRDFIQKNESPSFSQSLCGYWFISAKKLFEYIDKIEQGEQQ